MRFTMWCWMRPTLRRSDALTFIRKSMFESPKVWKRKTGSWLLTVVLRSSRMLRSSSMQTRSTRSRSSS